METLNSLLSPVSAAAKHLSHALRRVQDDFQSQAQKSGKGLKRDLGAAREELSSAVSRLGDATDQLRDSISATKSDYAEALRDRYQAGTEMLMDKYQAGADFAHSLKARASALTLPKLGADRRVVTRNNALVAGLAIGVGYLVYRGVRRMRAMSVDSARARADDVAESPKSRGTKPTSRPAKVAKSAKTSATATANGAADTTRPH